MKLAILGGGGVRMPAFVRAVLSGHAEAFEEIALFEPDPHRRETIGRLAVELAGVLGHPGVVSVTPDVEEAFTGADFVFSAIRVGGDSGRVVDEQVALRRGVVGQETTGPGGCAMALRTIPVVLDYAATLARVAPHAVLINFTNPAGIITQALSSHASVRAVGVCDTPSGTVERLARFLGAEDGGWSYSYGGLNHLGWITSFTVGGEERIAELLASYERLVAFDHRFAAFDPALVRRVGAIPTEYVYYYYDPTRYVDGVAHAGTSRGQDVERLNTELLAGIAKAFETGDVNDAWATYELLLGVRRDTYMRTDVDGDSGQGGARAARESHGPARLEHARLGGYEGIALQVIDGLGSGNAGEVIVNTRNGSSLGFLEPDDVVEVPALVHAGGIAPLATDGLSRSARALVAQVKEYERATVEAAVTCDADLAALALALHPLVPGVSVAREMMAEYRELHGRHLAYLR
ncbi:MAG: family 4 glycosyl hydrolase [Acidimicrobiales bacterium]